MVYCSMYKVAFATAARRDAILARLQQDATDNAADFFVAPQIGTYDGAYKFGPNWHFAINAEYRFKTQAKREAQWNQAQALLDSRAGAGGAVPGAFTEKWDQDLDHPDADQGRVNPVHIDY